MAPLLTSIELWNWRSIERLKLPLGGLTVLVGDNGGGKSTICEALELACKAARRDLVTEVEQTHGGLGALRRNARTVGFELCGLASDGTELSYRCELGSQPGYTAFLAREELAVGAMKVLRNTPAFTPPEAFKWLEHTTYNEPLLAQLSFAPSPATPQATAGRELRELALNIDVQLGFETGALWRRREQRNAPPSLREAGALEPAARLTRGADNLRSAYQALRNDFPAAHWEQTKRMVALGIGEIDELVVRITGNAASTLVVRFAGGIEVPAAALSDGQLSYLATVAMIRLNSGRSLLVVDEPELHMHPGLVVRVASMLEELAETTPVLVATHSDRFVDGLSRPAQSLRLLTLEGTTTVLHQPKGEALDARLKEISFSELRAAGEEPLFFERAEP